jgi:hypothetical protein
MADQQIPDHLPERLAVLERIAAETTAALADIRAEMRREFTALRAAMQTQYHWLLGIIVVALIAQGALWFQVGRLDSRLVQLDQISAQVAQIAQAVRR